MAIYKRGSVYWYEFVFMGQRIRETANTSSKEVAGRIERERRRSLELGSAGLRVMERPLIFSSAAKDYLVEREPHWAPNSIERQRNSCAHLSKFFSKMLLSDIRGEDISRYQRLRLKENASGRTINMEVGLLRQILRKYRLWANIQPDVRMLKERSDIGRALSEDEQLRILTACKESRSRSLSVAVLLSIHTGLRNAELRHLRWRQVDLIEKSLTVGKSKTAAGEGRGVPLSNTAFECLKQWRSQFPNAQPSHFVFPSEKYGLKGEQGYLDGTPAPYDIKPTVAIGSWKVAWTRARTDAGVECRWHDLRHTFISRMAESQASDATIMALAGHLSRKTMERYSHTRLEAKRSAISALDRPI